MSQEPQQHLTYNEAQAIAVEITTTPGCELEGIYPAEGGEGYIVLATYRGHIDSAGYPSPADFLSWSPDGALIASVDTTDHPVIHIWEAATGSLVTRYYGDEGSGYDYDFSGLSWSPDGTRIVSVSNFSGIQVWEAMSGNLLLRYHGHDSAGVPTAVAWSPDGKHIASIASKTVRVWQAE